MQEIKLDKAKFVTWVSGGYDGWHPHGYETLKDAIQHESYGSLKMITRGIIDWEATVKCPYPDCPKVKYKDCPVHGVSTTQEEK